LIATRQIIRLFASAGSESDFANFMLINGKIISIWKIVNYVISSDLKSKPQGITLTIPKFTSIKEANKLIPEDKNETSTNAAWRRSKRVNSAINSARIYAELHLKNLIAAIPSSV